MKKRYLAAVLMPVLMYACAPGVDVQPMLSDFDDYSRDLKAVNADEQAMKTLAEGQQKRDQAGALAAKNKKESVPLAEEALADARLALEIDRMQAAAARADQCRVEVEQARTKWSEAVYVLEQTEKFVGKDAPEAKLEPKVSAEEPALPASTLEVDSTSAAASPDAGASWKAWRDAAERDGVPVADLENTYRRSQDQLAMPKIDAATAAHQRYLAARATQALECRVRAVENDRVCLNSTKQTAAYANGRENALRATLDLERTLQADLRKDLDQLRAESKTRQEELRGALSQMEGKFASIRQDARGTIVSLADILFDFDKATLRRDVEFNLVKIATILNQFSEMNVLVEGHTDAIGSDEYNLELSKKRAQAVSDFLVSQGVDPKRLSWEGYGKTRPVADNDTPEGRQKNRRVDLVIQDASATKASN
ncbi:MAG TPA: OmpA family protein [Candidatus Krumholzibacteria bacterium]|nr:OmpA family protein [Candidatus Krumholzibacteria bacterium]